MQTILTDQRVDQIRVVFIVALFLAGGSYVLFTIHWPWMWDTQVMHYITLLLHHGKVPYRDILDINMPGSYLMESWAIDIFGGSNIGWRLYEFTMLAIMTVSMIVIAMPYDWLAGLLASDLFILLHGSEGPINSAQRDEVITVLILVGYALLFLAVRKARPVLMLPFGFLLGMAITVKPTVIPFGVVLLILCAVVVYRRKISPTPYVLYGLAGFAISGAIVLGFLMRQHTLGNFFYITRRLLPFYASLKHPTLGFMVRHSLPQTFLLYLPAALVLAFANKQRATWEIWAIRLGFLFGAVSYFAQQKGYLHHRYPYLAFALLWVGIEFTTAMRRHGWVRTLGVAATAFCIFLMLPFNAYKIRHREYTNSFADTLTQDLTRLGGAQLQNKVQCLDVVSGCLTALYRLDLVQSTGFTGDLQFFAPDDGKVVPEYRNIFLNDIRTNPPTVIVLSDQWFTTDKYTFDKLNVWPQLRDYLGSAYTLAATRDFGLSDGNDIAYRIYVLKGSPAAANSLSLLTPAFTPKPGL